MRRLLKRWYVWLGLVLFLGLAGSVVLICSGRGRITQGNFDRIRKGMSRDEVIAILGDFPGSGLSADGKVVHRHAKADSNVVSALTPCFLENAEIAQRIRRKGGIVIEKTLHLATAWETLQWYAKKIGVKWD
jgi:hypothetical protein